MAVGPPARPAHELPPDFRLLAGRVAALSEPDWRSLRAFRHIATPDPTPLTRPDPSGATASAAATF